MAGKETLKRLGGGRWESKDGRYSIEPQSGTWVVVDNEQTNELGLPLVRGPYPSLTAAREAVESGRDSGPATSPLAKRIAEAPKRQERKPAKPEPPPEPKWLRAMSEPDRRRVKAIVKRLESAGVDDAEDLARAEISGNQPALARLALERRLRKARTARQAIEAVLGGRDEELGARWRLVDGEGREIRDLEVD
jgi:hypothetical protein